MPFKELGAALKTEPLILPLGGKTYTFPGDLSAESWLLIRRVGQGTRFGTDATEPLTQAEEDRLMVEMFGDAMAEMLADGRTDNEMEFVHLTLLTFHLYGRDAAEIRWNAQGEAEAPSQEDASPEDTDRVTPTRGSTAGTTSPTKKPRAKASAGTKSSKSGT
ncbi:MAG: hypothetical protein ABFE13_12095 [Phycisphaerales bacterium]